MNRVAPLGFRIEPPNGAVGSLGGIGGTDHLAKVSHGVLALQRERDDGSGGHEFDQLRIKGSLSMNRVKFARLLTREPGHAQSEDSKSAVLQVTEDFSGVTRGDGIGLDNG